MAARPFAKIANSQPNLAHRYRFLLRHARGGIAMLGNSYFESFPPVNVKKGGMSSLSSSDSLTCCSRPQVSIRATSRRASLFFLPASKCAHSLDMNDLFNSWQSRFRQGLPNLAPLSHNVHENHNAHGPDLDSEAEFRRLINEGPPLRQSTRMSDEERFQSPSQSYGACRSALPTFDSQQTPSVDHFEDSQFPYGESHHSQPPTQEPVSKKRGGKTPVRKGKKVKQTIELSDSEDGVDGIQAHRWTDSEVSQLIAFRSEMDQDFKQNAKKQGINTWEKLQGRMVAACDNFVKSAEACRKKWKAIYNSYCNDKRLLQISGEGRKIACKFFDEIDVGFNNTANVRKLIHGDARGNPNPCPPDLNEQWETQESAHGTSVNDQSKDISPLGSKASKKSPTEHIASAITELVGQTADMVGHSANMVTQTTRMADDIHANGLVLKELQFHMARLVDKL